MTDRKINHQHSPEAGRNSPPDEAQIIALLERIQPYPSDRFYRRMTRAPWKSKQRVKHAAAIRPPSRVSWRFLVASIILLWISMGIAFAHPTLGALARQWMRFFVPNHGETIVLKVTVPSPGDPNVFGAPGYFSLSISEAEHLAGFKVRAISLGEATALIPGLEFNGAHYDAKMKAVILRYSVDGRHLYFTQYPIGQILEYNTIGPDAPVEKAMVHGVEGEYVIGGWIAARSEPTASQPGTQVSLDTVWDPNLPQRILRWQEADFLFEILASASLGREFHLDKEELIRIAESIQ